MTWPKQHHTHAMVAGKPSSTHSPMPAFCADLAHKTIDIPNYDIPTVGGRPIYLWRSLPTRPLYLHTPEAKADE